MASNPKSVNEATSNNEELPVTPAPSQSANGQTQKNGNKRKPFNGKPSTNNQPAKRGKPNHPNSGKRTEATFEKKSDSAVLSVFTLLPVFELHSAFMGVLDYARIFYGILQSRDTKMSNLFTENDMAYTLLLCVYYRCATVSNRSATKIIFGLGNLKSIAEGILLPDVLAQFVESFGQVKLSDGAIIVPFFDSYERMKRVPGFVDPLTILHRMDLIPDIPDWSICAEPVLRYVRASSKALRNSMELRTVKYAELEGRPELLACYDHSNDGTLMVTALDKIDQKQAQLGAACRYRIRSYHDFEVGIAIPPKFGAPPINADGFLTKHIVMSWRD